MTAKSSLTHAAAPDQLQQYRDNIQQALRERVADQLEDDD